MASAAFSFPILKPEEIISCLTELQIAATAADLKKPTAATSKAIYEALIEHCTGVRREELAQPRFHALDALSNQALHEESVGVIAFLRALSQLLNVCGVPGVQFSDLAHPHPKRFIRNLSAIINFAKFREERVTVYGELTQGLEELRQARQAKVTELQKWQEKQAELQQKLDADRPEIEATTQQCRELEADIEALNQHQAQLKGEINKLKESIAGINDNIASIKFEALNEQERITQLERQIVSSPDRLKSELRSLKATLRSERSEREAIDRVRLSLQTREDAIDSAEKELERTCKLMGEVEEEHTKYKQVLKSVRDGEQKIELHSAEMTELQTKLEHYKRAIVRTEQKITAEKPKAAAKTQVLNAAIAESRAELETLQGDLAAQRGARTGAKTQIDALEKVRAMERAKHQAEMAEMRACFERLQMTVSSYHHGLLSALGSAGAASAKPVGLHSVVLDLPTETTPSNAAAGTTATAAVEGEARC